jgi:hypothetical protein
MRSYLDSPSQTAPATQRRLFIRRDYLLAIAWAILQALCRCSLGLAQTLKLTKNVSISIFREQDAPRYATAFIIVLITAILTQVLTVIYRFLCVRENRKRDSSGIQEGFDHAYEDDLTDKMVTTTLLHKLYVLQKLILDFRIPSFATSTKENTFIAEF